MPGRRICLVSGSVAFLNSSLWKHQVADLMVYFGSFLMQNNFSIFIAKYGHILGAEKRRETEKENEKDALPSVASRRLSRPRGTGPRPPAQRGGVWRPSRAVTAVTQAASSRGS